jgi:hypothetical protein
MKPESPSLEEMQSALKAGGSHATPTPQAMEKLREKIRRGIENPRPAAPPTWRERLGWDADSKPVLIYVSLSAVAVCALLVFGLVNSRNVKPPAPGDETADLAPHLVARPTGGHLGAPTTTPGAKPEAGPRSTAPVLVNSASDRISLRPQPAPITATNARN